MNISKNDIAILRELGRKIAEIAALPTQQSNIKLWTDINNLKVAKSPIYINELPWNEMNVNNELTIQTEHPFCQELECKLRREIYSWNHFPGNMVVSPYIECPIVINDSGFGIDESVDIVKKDETSDVVSRHFNIQISSEEDICKIKDPIIEIDYAKTEENFQTMQEIFNGIIAVKKVGVKGYWFTPWDNLIRCTGISELMIDLIERPEYVNSLVERFVDASLVRMDAYKRLGLWASNNNNTRVGSGGYGYCDALAPAQDNEYNTPVNQLWGCGNAQIFSEVSPAMHWEFSLQHELRWIEQFGLSYYGCCEPLSNKLDIMAKIPNLRKISMSPWAKLERVTDFAKNKYVLSCKPNPAIFVSSCWSAEDAKSDILSILNKTKGCSIELILKDISTVSYHPERLWEWAKIAQETIDEFYNA